jgi:STE24 endopeptidase
VNPLLGLFLGLRAGQQVLEDALAVLNWRFVADPARQAEAARVLGLEAEEMRSAHAYAADRYRFGRVHAWSDVLVTLVFLAAGGLGAVESASRALAAPVGSGPVATGLAFFVLLGALGAVYGLPFSLYSTFVIEQKHGFNRQTVSGFFLDRLKGLAIAAVLGAPLLAAILWLIGHAGPRWWLFAWAATSGFNVFAAWIYPTVLAPLFNRFVPLPEGELRERILALATRVGFRTSGLYVMDASRRTAHGNAYFTGVFGARRIVLFDTLVESMDVRETVAVLAHELGHFKLHHVRWAVVRSVLATGALFYALSLCLPLASFYSAFGLSGPSAYGALVVFGLWFGLVDFLLQPVASHISRKNEFAADRYAIQNASDPGDLRRALLKLREKSRVLPLSHPLYSRVYHSHPPLLERLAALAEPR